MLDPSIAFDLVIHSKFGPVGCTLDNDKLVGLGFPPPGTPEKRLHEARFNRVVQALRIYFERPSEVPELDLELVGTPFQRRVWAALRAIQAGSVMTYGELARHLDTSPRAVGGACRANPCPIFVPCHRVVAARGRGGFAGATSGRWPELKAALLRHEGISWPAL